jgi:nitroreductase
MEFYEVVKNRRTIRDFADMAVPPDTIHRVLEAGLRAPTYNHLREWDFILVKDRATRLGIIEVERLPEHCDIGGLQQLFKDHDRLAKEMYLDAIPKQKRMILTAPELLVVAYKPKTQIAKSVKGDDCSGSELVRQNGG